MTNLDRRSLLAAAAGAALARPASAAAASQDARVPEGDPMDAVLALAPENPGKTKHTKFAVNCEMWFRGMDFVDKVRRAAELGFPAFEFWPYGNKDLDGLRKAIDETGIEAAQFTAWGFTPGLNDPKHEDAFVKRMEEACAVAKRLSCRKMTVVAGNDIPGVSSEAMLEQVTKALTRVKPLVEEQQVMLILEPMNGRVDHPGHCLYGSVDAVNICRAVDSPMVKINWDLYHMQISEGDLCGRLRDGIDQVGYVQLADHPGRFEPGTGEVHYNRVYRELIDLGYTDFVGLECRPKDGDDLRAAKRVWASDLW